MRIDKKEIYRQLNENPYFCFMPFLNSYVGTDGYHRICCEQSVPTLWTDYSDWNGNNYQKIRENILNGKPSRECELCYKDELNNGVSARLEWIGKYLRNGNTDLEVDFLDTVIGSNHESPTLLEFRPTNKCNNGCRMCHPYSSSILQNEAKNNIQIQQYGYIKPEKMQFYEDNRDLTNYDYSKIKHLKLLGGEPSISKSVENLLDHLIEIGNTDIKLEVSTNGAIWNRRFWNKVRKFSKPRVGVSVDGYGILNEYIRDGSNWIKVNRNIKKFMELFPRRWELTIHQCVMIYNIFEWFRVPRWASNLGLRCSTKLLYDPKEMRIHNMPRKWKDRALKLTIESDIKNSSILKVLATDEENIDLLKVLKTRTELTDMVKGKRLREYCADVYTMLDEIDS